jgi:hypothetical protein
MTNHSPAFNAETAGSDSRSAATVLPGNAFKEWAIVCDSIARGGTSLIFRKGGLSEGRNGFEFKYSRFFLFPTFFHEQIESTRLEIDRVPDSNPDTVSITLFVEMEFSRWITNFERLSGLEAFHILKQSVLRERFLYADREGLYVAFIRAYRLSCAWSFPFQKSFGGCRSWVDLPPPPEGVRIEPVLDFGENERRRAIVEAALS